MLLSTLVGIQGFLECLYGTSPCGRMVADRLRVCKAVAPGVR